MSFQRRPPRHTHPQRHQQFLRHKYARRRPSHGIYRLSGVRLQRRAQRQLMIEADGHTSPVFVSDDKHAVPLSDDHSSSVLNSTFPYLGPLGSSSQTTIQSTAEDVQSLSIPLAHVNSNTISIPSISPTFVPSSHSVSFPPSLIPLSSAHYQQPFDATPGLQETLSSLNHSPTYRPPYCSPLGTTSGALEPTMESRSRTSSVLQLPSRAFQPSAVIPTGGSSLTHPNLRQTTFTSTFDHSSSYPSSPSTSFPTTLVPAITAPPTLPPRPNANNIRAGLVIGAALAGCLATIVLLFGIMWLVRMRSRREDRLEYLSSIRGDPSDEAERVPDVDELPDEVPDMGNSGRVLHVTNRIPGDGDSSLNPDREVVSLNGNNSLVGGLGITLPPDAAFGTPRVAPPRFISVMRDGGLPLPPLPSSGDKRDEKGILQDVEVNILNGLSRLPSVAHSHRSHRSAMDADLFHAVSSVYSVASEARSYAPHPSMLPADGWAAILRSNLYAAIQRMASTASRTDGYRLRDDEVPEPWTKQLARPTSQRRLRASQASRGPSVRSTVSLNREPGVTPMLEAGRMNLTSDDHYPQLKMPVSPISTSVYSRPSVLHLPPETEDDISEVELPYTLPKFRRVDKGPPSHRVSSTHPNFSSSKSLATGELPNHTIHGAQSITADGAPLGNTHSSHPRKSELEVSGRPSRPFLRQRQSVSAQSSDELT